MVNPYLQRKAGQIETEYLHPSLACHPVRYPRHHHFQEQVLEMSHQLLLLLLDEADEFRPHQQVAQSWQYGRQ